MFSDVLLQTPLLCAVCLMDLKLKVKVKVKSDDFVNTKIIRR